MVMCQTDVKKLSSTIRSWKLLCKDSFEPVGRQPDVVGPSVWGIAADHLDLNMLTGMGHSKAGPGVRQATEMLV